MSQEKPSRAPTDSCVLVLFGAGGDLTKRLLLPALYNLLAMGLLPEQFALLGITRDQVSDDEFRKQATEDLNTFATAHVDSKLWSKIVPHLCCLSGDFDDPKLYGQIKTKLAQMSEDTGISGNALFYLATPPQFFGPIVQQIGRADLMQESKTQWRRVVIEKPFGHDLASAQALNKQISEVLQEPQIFRMDHYLGKETVQNILVFRFANGIFEPVWNRNYIAQVQITVAENIGIEARGGYYDGAGALRDMMQNHLFQMLSLVAMEAPISMEANALRDQKTQALHSISPLKPEDVLTQVVRGQYGAGVVGGKSVPAYRSEAQVAPTSNTETFVAMTLEIDNWRWAGVPFSLRTGKRLPARVTEIAIQFKRPPALLFRDTPVEEIAPNWLMLHIQPSEGIALQLGAKMPGPTVEISPVDMSFAYQDYFGASPSTGYETLLYDAMIGDQTLFQRADTVEAGWNVVQPILDVWAALPPRDFPNYAPGTWGPPEADALLQRHGFDWRLIQLPSAERKKRP